jgi:hypothetical protein
MRKILLIALFTLSTAGAQIPDSLNPYVRKPKATAVSLELGGNSLASLLGVKGTVFINPQFAVDVGLGISGTGYRPGVYARYLFSKAKMTPYVYGGAKFGLGTNGQSVEIDDPETDQPLGLEIKPSPFIDAGVGLDYMAHSGFYFNLGLGWSQLLGGRNYEYTSGTPSNDAYNLADFAYGSGLALFLSLGFAF